MRPAPTHRRALPGTLLGAPTGAPSGVGSGAGNGGGSGAGSGVLTGRLSGAWLGVLLCLGMTGCALRPVPTEPVAQQLVAEDDQVRIAETRVRGQTQKLTVQPKQGGKAYDIVPAPGGQDPSRAKDGTGQRVWTVFSF